MTTISQPNINASIIGANTTVENQEQKVLFVGTSLAGAAEAPADGSLTTNIGDDEAVLDSLYDSKSPLAVMLRQARKLNKVTRFDAINKIYSGVQASSTVTFSGVDALVDGVITINIGSSVNFPVTLVFEAGDTAVEIATQLDAFLNGADAALFPFTSSRAAGVVTISNAAEGTNGNKVGISFTQTLGTGVIVAISAFSGGSGFPGALPDVFDVIGDERYQTIAWEYTTGGQNELNALVSFLDSRFNVDNKVLDGIGVCTNTDIFSTIETITLTLNSESILYIADKFEDLDNHRGPSQLEIDWIKTAEVAAIRSLRLTPGASIADFVISTAGPLDAFGGPALASKPYFNTPFRDLPIIDINKGWKDFQIEDLLSAGASVLGNNIARNSAIAGEFVTTYKTDNAGNPDVSFKFLNAVDTMSGIREYYFNNYRSRFAQSRLTTGDVVRGRDVVNELVIRAFSEKLFQDLAGEDFVLVQAGEVAQAFYKQNLTISINTQSGTVTLFMLVPIIIQLRSIIAPIQLSFTANI